MGHVMRPIYISKIYFFYRVPRCARTYVLLVGASTLSCAPLLIGFGVPSVTPWPHISLLGDEHFKLLGDMLDTLESMITRHKADGKAHYVDVTTKWLTAKSKATCAKLRQILLRLLRDTYTPGNLHALQHIRSRVASNHTRLKADYSQLHKSLQMYQSLGDTFRTTAGEFAVLLDEIANKRWALKELSGQMMESAGGDGLATPG